jgi:DNA-binding response OmpR family regulator
MADQPLVLVIEDEYLLQADLVQALNDAGFATEAASSGASALALFSRSDKSFQAIVTDVNLGEGANGWEVVRLIREKNPEMPVVYVTASTAEEWASHGVPNSILVHKPFAPAQLIAAVSGLINVG